jgi:dGTPase
MSPQVAEAMQKMRRFMNRNLYTNQVVKGEEARAEALVEALYKYYRKRPELLPDYLIRKEEEGASRDRIVCDFISSMTDRFAISTYQDLFIPKTWSIV